MVFSIVSLLVAICWSSFVPVFVFCCSSVFCWFWNWPYFLNLVKIWGSYGQNTNWQVFLLTRCTTLDNEKAHLRVHQELATHTHPYFWNCRVNMGVPFRNILTSSWTCNSSIDNYYQTTLTPSWSTICRCKAHCLSHHVPTNSCSTCKYFCMSTKYFLIRYKPIPSKPRAPVSAGDIKELDGIAAAVKSKAAPPATTGKFTEKSN